MSVVKRYTDLIAWQKSMDLVELIYQITKSFPLRRCAVSIPSDIAEGHWRNMQPPPNLAPAFGPLASAV